MAHRDEQFKANLDSALNFIAAAIEDPSILEMIEDGATIVLLLSDAPARDA